MADQPSNPYRRGPRRPRPEPARVVGPGGPRGLRELPPDLHALADGRENRLRRPRTPKNQALEDDRARHVIPGVRNSESRIVYDRRVLTLRDAVARDDADALGLGLFEAQCLGLWRARNITDFDAFAEDVVGTTPERARALAATAAERASARDELRSVGGVLSAEVVALWVRTEAALIPVAASAVVRIAFTADGPWLQVHVPAQPPDRALEALKSIGPGITGLGKLFASGSKPPER